MVTPQEREAGSSSQDWNSFIGLAQDEMELDLNQRDNAKNGNQEQTKNEDKEQPRNEQETWWLKAESTGTAGHIKPEQELWLTLRPGSGGPCLLE